METTHPGTDAGLMAALATLERRNRNLHRVNQVSQQLTSLLDAGSVIAQLLQAAAEIIGAPVASFWTWEDESRQHLVCRGTFPVEAVEELRAYRLPVGQGVAGWVVGHKISAVTDNAYADRRFNSEVDRQTGFMTQSMLAVPLILRDEVIGVAEILNKQRAHFDDEDLAMVETLAAAAAIALENANLVASLREKSEQLQAQNAEIDAFAHTVAHDLKSPLSAILGYSDFLMAIDYGLDTQELARVCAVVARSATKMNSIIQEILLLSGLRKADGVTLTPVAMEDVVEEALARLDQLCSEAGAVIQRPSHWPSVRSYAPWLEEVWVNYLSNAVKYGGRPPVIALGYTEEQTRICFWVQDNGRGLTTEEQALLFRPYTRLEQTRAKGHGLGLSIVQQIIHKLGGTVAVSSEIGRGSRFSFCLPRLA